MAIIRSRQYLACRLLVCVLDSFKIQSIRITQLGKSQVYTTS